MQKFTHKQRLSLVDLTTTHLTKIYRARHKIGVDKELIKEFKHIATIYRILTNPSLYGY